MDGKRMAAAAAFCAALTAAGCAGRTSTIGKGAPAPAAPDTVTAAETAPDSAAAGSAGHGMPGSTMGGRAQADLLWIHRGNPDTARMALAAYRDAARDFHDPALLARLSRAYYLVANYVETDPAAKDSLFLKGVEAAERAMSQDTAFVRIFKETHDEKKAVQALGMDYIDAIYWYSANLGKWTASKSLMVRLGNKSKLEAFSKRVLDLDEHYFHGAAHRFFGALPTKVPGGDLNDSKRHFEKAIAIEPNYFGTRTLYAELYATKARDKETFVKQLDYVLATPPSSLPDAEPENRYEQDVARKLKEHLHEWFD